MEWKKLGNIIKYLPGGSLKRDEVKANGLYPVMNGGIDYSGYYDEYNYDENVLTVSHWGSSASHIHRHNGKFWANNACWVFVPKDELDCSIQYLYQVLKERENTMMQTMCFGGATPNLNRSLFEKQEIPIPSLSEQKRIVGILDTFTSAIDNLKEQIAQRRKQYEYYRDQLLDLEGKPGVEMKTLPEISDNRDRVRKPITSSKRKAGNYPYYGASGIVDFVDGYIFDGDYLLISEDGANLIARSTPIAFSINGKNWVNNHAHVLQFKDKATQKFVEIYLNMIDLEPWINGAAQPKLNQENLNKISIPLPPLSEQQRIVSILDTFEASIANLEAQLKEREKQYEYYRNQLLTFE